jgi:hypothetical protein
MDLDDTPSAAEAFYASFHRKKPLSKEAPFDLALQTAS